MPSKTHFMCNNLGIERRIVEGRALFNPYCFKNNKAVSFKDECSKCNRIHELSNGDKTIIKKVIWHREF